MILLYAVTSATPDPLAGQPAEVRAHANGRVAVLYEPVEAAPERTTENLLSFGRTVCRLWSSAPVLPVRFGCTADDVGQLDSWLSERGDSWSERLAELDGRVEMILHVPLPAADESPAPHGSGREYLLARARELARKDAATGEARRLLGRWTEDVRPLPGIRPDEERLAFLIPRDRVAAARAEVEDWSRDRPGTQLSGPWPPFSFCEEVVP